MFVSKLACSVFLAMCTTLLQSKVCLACNLSEKNGRYTLTTTLYHYARGLFYKRAYSTSKTHLFDVDCVKFSLRLLNSWAIRSDMSEVTWVGSHTSCGLLAVRMWVPILSGATFFLLFCILGDIALKVNDTHKTLKHPPTPS